MTEEQILNEIKKIDMEIKALEENRCESFVCITNEHKKSLRIQELLENRTELYYKLNIKQDDKKVETKDNAGNTNTGLDKSEDKVRHEEKIEIAKNLLDVLGDDVIASKTELSIEEVKSLRNGDLA